MKIIFDNIVFSLQKAGGISVVWYEIIKRAINEPTYDISFIEYNDSSKNIFRNKLSIPANYIIQKSNSLLAIKRYLNISIKSDKKFIFHSSYYRTCKKKNAINITTVHDFTYEKYKHGLAKRIHCFQKYNAIKNSDVVVCISENTKNDLLFYLPTIDKLKIEVIYNGVSNDYFKITSEVELHFKKLNYVLFVGSRENYKRFDLTVDVLKDFDYKLVIVGGGNLTSDEIEFLNMKLGKNNYLHLGRLKNEELNLYYNNAFCLLYPSEYEGFGIPVIEAQKAGCPVIAFNGSSIKEISNNSCVLFEKHDKKDVSECLKKLTNNSYRDKIVAKGLENAKLFTWEKTYSDYLAIYNRFKTVN
jgi:mannosyltransferase